MKKSSSNTRKLVLPALLTLIFLIIAMLLIRNVLASKMSASQPENTAVQDGSALLRGPQPSDIDAGILSVLVNKQREVNGLADLSRDARLDASATAKCQDMVTQNYWSHFNSQGIGINEWIEKQGVPFLHYGENLAEGETSPEQTVSAWMRSPEHKANILDTKFTAVGYAVCKSDNFVAHNVPALIVVQHFAQE